MNRIPDIGAEAAWFGLADDGLTYHVTSIMAANELNSTENT